MSEFAEEQVDVLNRLITWAEGNEDLQSVLRLGSQAAKGPSDERSDYSIVLHVVVPRSIPRQIAWHDVEIGEVWHCFKGDKELEQGYWRAVIFPLESVSAKQSQFC